MLNSFYCPFVKAQITRLGNYYLLGQCGEMSIPVATLTVKQQNRIDGFTHYLQKESYIIAKINSKLRADGEFPNLSALEKAVLAYAAHEILYNQQLRQSKTTIIFINRIIIFCKKYLGTDKYKYINKVLDLIYKEPEVKLILYFNKLKK